MSYLIANNKVVGITTEHFKAGETVNYSSQRTAELVDASREYNLVNAKLATISNASSWRTHPSSIDAPLAEKIGSVEFYIA